MSDPGIITPSDIQQVGTNIFPPLFIYLLVLHMYFIFRRASRFLSPAHRKEGPEQNGNLQQLMSTFGGAPNNTRVDQWSSIIIAGLLGTTLSRTTPMFTHWKLPQMNIWYSFSLVYYSACFTDNKVLLLLITSEKRLFFFPAPVARWHAEKRTHRSWKVIFAKIACNNIKQS